jgi:hypothetical protein
MDERDGRADEWVMMEREWDGAYVVSRMLVVATLYSRVSNNSSVLSARSSR